MSTGEQKSYSEKLRDPRWQQKRLKIMERDNWTCQACLDSTKTLNVHHRRYEKGREPWEYEDVTLVTLCEDCHQFETDYRPGAIGFFSGLVNSTWLANDFTTIGMAFARLPEGTRIRPLILAIAYHLSSEETRARMLGEYMRCLKEMESPPETGESP